MPPKTLICKECGASFVPENIKQAQLKLCRNCKSILKEVESEE